MPLLIGRHIRLAPALALLAAAIPAAPLAGQTTPKVFYACYVPLVGTVYRIKETGLPQQCFFSAHVPFSWTDGASALHTGDAAGGDLAGTYPNPTVAKLLGTALSSTAPASGQVLTFNGTSWAPAAPSGSANAVNIGDAAGGDLAGTFPNPTVAKLLGTALSSTPPASGQVLTFNGASWAPAAPSGSPNVACNLCVASGTNATAVGDRTQASGDYSTATGLNTTASGTASTAMGDRANTNQHSGSFVYGDFSTTNPVFAMADNEFVVRAAGGTIFYSAGDLSAGVSLSPGGGAWQTVSDVNRKEHFIDVSGEAVLAEIAHMPVREWNYKAQPAAIRHLGPTAQDFYAAFGLGESDTTITTTDIDGVNLLAVKALEARTARLRQRSLALARENRVLRAALERMRYEQVDLARRTARLEASRKQR